MAQGESARSALTIAGSFVFEPGLEAIDFLARKLQLDLKPRLSGYGRLFPELLDPQSVFRRSTARVVAARWRDLAGGVDAGGAALELAEAILAADDDAPTLVILCSAAEDDDSGVNVRFERAVQGSRSISVLRAAEIFADYAVAEPFDLRADAAAHIPYAREAFAALGAAIVRWRSLALRPPVKLIAVDGDNTLWDGVLGEDGSDGIGLSPSRRRLQRRLVEAAEGGQIVALLSKNEDEDVVRLFTDRADFPLRLEHILARRVNWRAKAENLKEIAAEFGVGAESIVFLDDNPVECAAMRASLPGALTIRVPDGPDLEGFPQRLWPLDRPELTLADAKRLDTYRAEAERKLARQAAPTLSSFFDSLELRIDIAPAEPRDYPRIAQMSQRTNQFNTTLKRLEERDLDKPGSTLCIVSVKDRFGDYGVVGAMRAFARGHALVVDLFMLSCRALGRGVEHAMARELGRIAEAGGLTAVTLDYVEGPRNGPALRFLVELTRVELFGDGAASVATETARAMAFDCERASFSPTADEEGPKRPAQASSLDRGAAYEWIASECLSGAAILSAMSPSRPRPPISAGFSAPAPGLQSEIARIWEEALGIAPVGVNDPIKDLGGASLHLVRIHGLLADRLGVEIDLAHLFRFATVAELAAHLNDVSIDRVAAAAGRAAKMRGARLQAAARAARAATRLEGRAS